MDSQVTISSGWQKLKCNYCFPNFTDSNFRLLICPNPIVGKKQMQDSNLDLFKCKDFASCTVCATLEKMGVLFKQVVEE